MLFKEIIAVYSENCTKPTNKDAYLQTGKTTGTYNYHKVLTG